MRGGQFKSAAEVAKKNHAPDDDNPNGNGIVSFSPGDIVSAIMDNGTQVPCRPRPWEGVSCPMCGNTQGSRVKSGPDNKLWWACRKPECIQKNVKIPPKQDPASAPIETFLAPSGVPRLLQRATFDDWKHGDAIMEAINSWLIKPQGFCVLSGAKGRGKTYIACCIIGHQARFKGSRACFMDVVEAKYQWLEEMRSDCPKTLPSKMTQCELLVIDDIDKVNPSDSFYEFMYLVINSRYTSERPTVITTNKSLEELEAHLGAAISSRIFAKESLLIEVQGEDLRQ